MIIKKFRPYLFVGLLAATNAWADDTNPPQPINDLMCQTGSQQGSISLQWTEPYDDSPSEAVQFYLIKYQSLNTISTDSIFDNARRMDAPPLNQNPPSPAYPYSSISTTLTGLEAGSIYGFAIKSIDEGGNFAPLSNSCTAQAKAACTQGAYDGQGVATLSPTIAETGQLFVATMVFVAGINNIETGGKIRMRVPDFWPTPQTSNSNNLGYVSYGLGSGVSALFTLSTNGQTVTLEVISGTLNYNEIVKIYYNAFTCDSLNPGRFRVESEARLCGKLTALAGSPYSVVALNGPAQFIAFDTGILPVVVNQPTAIRLSARNYCGKEVNVPNNTTVNIRAGRFSSGVVINDTVATLATSSSMAGAFVSGTGTIPNGQSSVSLYYLITSSIFSPNNGIELNFNEFNPPNNPISYFTYVLPVSGGITNARVNTSSSDSGTSVTFSPDNDGSKDNVFVSATLPIALNWKVEIGTSIATPLRTFYGNGTAINVAWDGFTDGLPGIPPVVAEAGTYVVKISVVGNTLAANTSLTIILDAQSITGRVIKESDSSPLADVDLDVFGPSNRYGRTRANGTFQITGLKPGSYKIRTRKPGFEAKETSATLGNTTLALPDIAIKKQAFLRLTVTRPATGSLQELWGNVNAYTSNWSQQNFATVHFGEGKTTADAGDLWNTPPTSTIDVSFSPGNNFSIRFDIPGLSANAISIPALTVDEVRPQTVNLTRSPDITGKITLPATAQEGVWVSVVAQKSGTPIKRYYGGTYISNGSIENSYRVTGVENGSYSLEAYAPGFIPATASITISGGADGLVDFPVLSQGGSLTGGITVNGDTSSDSNSSVNVSLNARLKNSPFGSFVNVSVASHTTTSSTTYSLKGLADGTYEIYSFLDGFDLVPPGPKTGVVSGGTGTLNLTFQQFSGTVQGSIILPNSNTDYGNVTIELLPFGNGGSQSRTATINTGAGTYVISKVGNGFYTVRAYYSTTKFVRERTLQIANGQTVAMNLDVAGQTYSISGKVTTEASSPFNSIDYYVNTTTPTTLNTPEGSMVVGANRIKLQKVEGREFHGDQGDDFIDPKRVKFGIVDSNGDYTITGLPSGVYQLTNNGEMNNNNTDGKELSEESIVVNITNASVTDADFILKDGTSISGTLRIADGSSESGWPIQVFLMDAQQRRVVQQTVFLDGTSTDFTLTRIPPGTYTLSAKEFPSGTSSGGGTSYKYWANSIQVELGSESITGKEIILSAIGRIQGQLRIKNGDLLTQSNWEKLLGNNFRIFAKSNPHKPNGFSFSEFPLINSSDKFSLYVGEGTFDMEFLTENFGGQADLAQGIKPFIKTKISGINVLAGQTKDIGTIDLVVGEQMGGTITNTSGTPLANILVVALQNDEQSRNGLEGSSNDQGKYLISGLDKTKKYTFIAAPYPDAKDNRFLYGFDGQRYGEVRKINVDLNNTTSVNFELRVADGGISGRIVTPDAGQLLLPFSGDDTFGVDLPGASVILNKKGDIPTNNPIGNFEVDTDADGYFSFKGLSAGFYDLTAITKGYGSVKQENIEISNSIKDIGTLTVTAGSKLTGMVLNGAGEAVATSLVSGMIAVSAGFNDIIIASILADSAGSITSYEMYGFKANTVYNIIGFSEEDDIVSFGSVLVNSDSTKDLTLKDSSTGVFPVVKRETNGDLTIVFKFSAPLDNSTADLDSNGLEDASEPDKIITLSVGNGTLSFAENALATDRKSLTCTFTSSDQGAFTLQLAATFNKQSQLDGNNITVSENYTFYPGIGNEITVRVPNVSGGQADLEGAEFSPAPGTFGDNTDDAESIVDVTFREAATIDNLPVGANPNVSGVLALSDKVGLQAFPSEMAMAIKKIKTLDVDPFSSFYDIFLPLGVSHSFPSGKEAKLCLNYTTVAGVDPENLNIYYFNPNTSEYLLENDSKLVDTENSRICINVAHASVFTVLNSNLPVIAGTGYTGELEFSNFPNPFNLKSKTVTLRDPDPSVNATPTINGTMIKLSVPSNISGSAEIKIFNVLGEIVRTLNIPITSGIHNYVEWDGKNDNGDKVASGTYIARVTIGGANEKFFKMAVLK